MRPRNSGGASARVMARRRVATARQARQSTLQRPARADTRARLAPINAR
jgi:hypothetical protein